MDLIRCPTDELTTLQCDPSAKLRLISKPALEIIHIRLYMCIAPHHLPCAHNQPQSITTPKPQIRKGKGLTTSAQKKFWKHGSHQMRANLQVKHLTTWSIQAQSYWFSNLLQRSYTLDGMSCAASHSILYSETVIIKCIGVLKSTTCMWWCWFMQ